MLKHLVRHKVYCCGNSLSLIIGVLFVFFSPLSESLKSSRKPKSPRSNRKSFLQAFAQSFHQGSVWPQEISDIPAEEDSSRPISVLIILAPTNHLPRWMGRQWGCFWWWGGVCWDKKSLWPTLKLHTLLLNMTLVSRMMLLLGLLSSGLGSALQREEKEVRRLHAEFGNDEGRRTSESSGLSKRSAGLNEQTCTAPPGLEATLREDTHSVSEPVGFLSPRH